MRHIVNLEDSQLLKVSPFPIEAHDGHQVKSGNIYLVQTVNRRSRRIPVYVQVYRNSFEHYAVVSRNKLCPKCMFLNLRNSFVMHNDNDDDDNAGTELKVVSNDLEGTSLVLDVVVKEDVADWVDVLQSDSPASSPKLMSSSPPLSSSVRKMSQLQTLTESEEE
ncbi:uncharacterized protein LOC121375934 [Gigantopelta aegis]|uniref:uncharacterized protein LOC121375934 n=1 Tax=Gigantopelta aegis TaxID=1735272 RepID=UPI001B88B22E|nr:uncharacterized protein LOC121375934 [Gigantopelta aegis]